jgi:hypothetical protein
LTGKTLNINGHALQVGMAHTRLLSMTSTLYCRHMVTESDQSEEAFLQIAVEQLQARGVGFKKILCGKGSFFSSPQGGLSTRSLMVAGLSLDDAVTLQEQGLGPLRSRGFGLFIPHKTV